MIISAPKKRMSSDEFAALPDVEGVTRQLIRGELREIVEDPMTKRNPDHSSAMINIGAILRRWVQKQRQRRGRVYGGEAYFRLQRDPDVNVGIDVAYISPKLAAKTPRGSKFVDGAPQLAIEVLSPHDKQEDIHAGIDLYLESGVKIVWIVDPFNCTVTVYRPDHEPEMFNVDDVIPADPLLPGLKVPVSEIFDY